jgi:hypothetical protein
MGDAYIFVGRYEKNKPPGTARHRWSNNNNNLKGIGCEGEAGFICHRNEFLCGLL